MNALIDKLAARVEQGEVYRTRSRTVPVQFLSGRLDSIKTNETEGMALRVIADGKLGFATTTDVQDHKALIDAAVAASAFGDTVGFRFPETGEPTAVDVYDPTIAALSEEQMVALGEDIISRLTKIDPDADINMSVVKSVDHVSIENTSGCRLEEERPLFSVSLEVAKAREGDIFILSDSANVRCFDDFESEPILARIARFLEYGEKIAPAPSRALPVAFTPSGAITLLLPLIVGFNGKSVYMGTSPLKGRIGDRAFDEQFSLVDDGTISHGPRSGGFDDEGTPTTATPLIENGTVNAFTYDLRTAALAGVRSTGNGYKGGLFGGGFRRVPTIGVNNVIVAGGETPEEQLISEIEEGLLVESVLGLGQGNIAAGEFSNNVAVGFKIESGKVVGRVKNTMIAGNVYALLGDGLIGLSNTRRWVHGGLYVPTVVVDGVSVVGRGE